MKKETQFNSLNIDSNNNAEINNIKTDEFLIDINDENEKELLLEQNNTNKNNIPNKKKLSKKNEIVLTLKPEIPKKIEDRIICFSRRRKMPKNLGDLTGYLITLSFFLFFSILITICLCGAKSNSIISDSTKKFHNWVMPFIWLTCLISVICLTDAASADPGRQRGTPISVQKYKKNDIKKIVGGQKYVLKYCVTCHLIRDIRTFHCSTCGLCIEKHDHHCNYLSNCVGVYNYKKFFIFVLIACIHVTIVFTTSIHYLFFCQGEKDENSGYEWIIFFMTLIVVFGGFFTVFTWWMVIQHIITIMLNRTTREFIKNKEYGIYNKGCRQNCREALCSNRIKEI